MRRQKEMKPKRMFNVLLWGVNNKTLVTYDVLPYFRDEYKKCTKAKKPITEEQWTEFVSSKGMYRFWSRCEYEIIISPWPPEDINIKIDVWQQIKNNLAIVVQILMEEFNKK